jgi:hypothetical protein
LATALEATNSSVRSPAVFIQGASGNVNQFLIQLLKIHFPNVAIIGSASPNKHQGLQALNVIPVPYNDGTAESADEFELSQVNQILEQTGNTLVGIVDTQGRSRGSVQRHYDFLVKLIQSDSLQRAVLVCVLSSPGRVSEEAASKGLDVHSIALGGAYDAAATGTSKVPAYAESSDPIDDMASSYRAIVDLVNQGKVQLPQATSISVDQVPNLTLQDLNGNKLVFSFEKQLASGEPNVAISKVQSSVLTRVVQELKQDAARVVDTLIGAIDPLTGLIAMELRADGIAASSNHSSLDSSRATRGLVEFGLSVHSSNPNKTREIYRAALQNWRRTREWLRSPDQNPIHTASFFADAPPRVSLGEHGTRMRVNADGLYPVSDSATLAILADQLGERNDAADIRATLISEMQSLLKNFYDTKIGTFCYHSDALDGSHFDEDTRGKYQHGVVGNDGTVYGLSALLIPALQAFRGEAEPTFLLDDEQLPLSTLVRDQMDLISKKFLFMNGSLWENYALSADGLLQPIAFDWQSQNASAPYVDQNGTTRTDSHVGIGGHTVMAAGQLVMGALELRDRGTINDTEFCDYCKAAVNILNNAIRNGVIDWGSGLVRNGVLVEVPAEATDRILPWGEAAWQHYELARTLLALRDADFLNDVKVTDSDTGWALLEGILESISGRFRLPAAYTGGFGDEWRYHLPQLVRALSAQ